MKGYMELPSYKDFEFGLQVTFNQMEAKIMETKHNKYLRDLLDH